MKSFVVVALEQERKKLQVELARVEKALALYGAEIKGGKKRKKPGPKPGTKRKVKRAPAEKETSAASPATPKAAGKKVAKKKTTPLPRNVERETPEPAPVRSKGGLAGLAARRRESAAESE